ncbi:cupin domain-containing protein, partial [Ilumatobacter sp.]|uniref:cupin domain-containing protein n=1 Tax=Ilumatobacter sp. TaxID=1967498 RepID=UPI003C40ABF0
MTLQSPTLVAAGAGDHYHFLNHLFTTKVSSEDSNGQMTVMEFTAGKDFAPPLHRHDIEDEMFYVVEGEVWFSCGGVEAVHSAGAVVWLPRKQAHTFQVRSDMARVLQVSTPAQFERFVATLGSPTPEPTMPEPEDIDPDHVAAICAQFGIQVLG